MINNVFWEIVPGEKCNLKCIGCYAANNKRPDYRMVNKGEAMMIVKKLIELNVKKIDFLGGEPLLCNFLDDIILEYKTYNPSIFIGIVSNGILLTKRRANNLKMVGLNQISISIDGVVAKTNDWSRGEGSFLKILKGIENAKNAGLNVSISYTITKKNLAETEKFIPFAEKIGAKSVGVQIIESNYIPFNKLMRYDAVQNFLTCKECSYHFKICDPCPLANLSEKIKECEWVKEKIEFYEKLVLKSKIALKIKPIDAGNKIILLTPIQITPVYINMAWEKFIQIFGSGLTGKEIFSLYLQQNS